MRLTERDLRLVEDLSLSNVLSRDQIIGLGYFTSVTRANTRLRELVGVDVVRRFETPFFRQTLYVPGPMAGEVILRKVSRLANGRKESPRFVQHSLAVTDVRLALVRNCLEWRHEPLLWRKLACGKEVRPDGLLLATKPIFVEVDLGNVSLPKLKAKISSYRALAFGAEIPALYRFSEFRLLVVTTGNLRARHIRRLDHGDLGFDLLVQTFADLGLVIPSHWS